MTTDSSLQGTWVVISYRAGDEMVDPDDRTQASLTIDGTLVSGSMGVNRFSSRIDTELPFGPFATTRLAGPPELMRQEDMILEHLEDADMIEVIEDGMTLSRNGLLLIELERTESTGFDRSS